MNIDAFRHIRRGIPISTLAPREQSLLAPVNLRNGKTERALLLLHGFSSSPAVFRLLFPQLIPCYDAIVCPVLPGHAQDLAIFAEAKAQDWLNQATESCGQLSREFRRVDVLGLSLGGLLACHLSHQFPLAHLYLLAPALDLQLKLNKTLNLAKIMVSLGFSQIRSAAGNLYTDKTSEIAYRTLPISVIIEMLSFVKQFQFVPPACPTDLFLGCYDEVVDCARVALRFAEKTNVSLHWLENSAHILPLDGDYEQIIACIKQNIPICYSDRTLPDREDANPADPALSLEKP